MVRRSPTGACQCWRVLASPRNPRSSRLATSTSLRIPSSPTSFMSSWSWQLPGQPPSSHNRSPQIVLTDRPWAVWLCRLASYSTLWSAHPRGRCTTGRQPIHHHRLAGCGHLHQQPAQVIQGGDEGPVGLNPRAPSGPSSRSRLSPTSVLEIPTARPARRYDSPSSSTAATASRRISSDSGGCRPGRVGGMAQVDQAAGQPGQHVCRQRRTWAV
jgi:hypothetical protein